MRSLPEKRNNEEMLALHAALLNWYPFSGGERALLLGDYSGALLELLESHYALTDTALNAGTKYDCIVVADWEGSKKDIDTFLQNLYERLSDTGVLLLAFRNRFGIRYLCGGTDELVTEPFSTLQRADAVPRLFAKREMEAHLRKAGFVQPEYYYLMPDMQFVQAVYTDGFLPRDTICDRVFPFDLFYSPLIAWEGDLYDDLAREGTLPDLCNVYLAECRKPTAPVPEKRVIYAALSTDRGEEHAFATVLYSDETACKTPLFPAGRKTLEEMFSNITALRNRGVLTVPQVLTETGIEMPLVREESLMHYLRRQLTENPRQFLKVFEMIYQDVLRSSPQQKELPDKLSEIWGAEAEALMPVLEAAWIDMVPYNAFWADGKIRYYDQEFSVPCCPAKYVLFRAIYYTWLRIPEAESVFPLESVKERFGLQGLWEGFSRREERFVNENRRKEELKEIYDFTWPDRKAIARRRATLDSASLLKRVHAVQLELLKELDRVCRENGLQYMAVHGTLLGAVRHQGFIPWDDDVDVAMPREDYDRLLSLGKKGFAPGFFLQTPMNSYGCFYGGYSKLRRDGTKAVERQNAKRQWNRYHMGIWIDIFPLDACPPSKEGQRSQQKKLSFLQRIVYAKAYTPEQFVPPDVPGSRLSLYYLLAKCTRRRDLLKRIDGLCRRQENSPLRGILACYYGNRENRNVWTAGAVGTVMELPFEDMLLPVPAGWDEVLRKRYGDDYMNLPPVEKRYRHDNVDFQFSD